VDIADLLRGAPLIDGHNDLLWALRELGERGGGEPDLARPVPELQTDLPRLEAGGVGAQFWSVYVPSYLPPIEAVTRTLEQFDAFYALMRRYPGRLEQARTPDDVERIAASGRIASMIGVEGGHQIGDSLGTLRILARLGAGYLTLTHNDDTPWADSATGDHPHGGLTAFGEEVVRELNRLGVLVDLSHVSDDVMRQALELSEAPVIFSHSSARALCDVARNVPDDVIELIGRTGGVIMVTFVPTFVAPEGAEANRREREEARRIREEHADDPEALRAAMDVWWNSFEEVPSNVAQVADHVDHIRAVAGVDNIGIGGDYDGAGSMPDGLADVSGYPALFAELAARGYTEDELLKIAGRNVLRVMREAEEVSERLGMSRATGAEPRRSS
jgi:membrane dipeptidase